MNEQQRQEALRFARETGRKYDMPEDLSKKIMQAMLEAREFGGRGHPCGDYPLNFDDDTMLDPSWDDERDPLDAGDFPLSAGSAATVTGFYFDADGTVKVVERGYRLEEESLDKLGNPELSNTINDLVAASKALAAMEKEKRQLEKQTEELRRFIGYEPTLIKAEIKRAFPEGTAGQTVAITTSDGENFELLVNGYPNRSVAVSAGFGRAIVARQKTLEQSKKNINDSIARQHELEKQIADLRATLPMLKQKAQHLTDGLNPGELKNRLNGRMVALTLNQQGQPVALVEREVHHESAEVPAEVKRRLLAQHLSGNKLPEAVLKNLGLDQAVQAVDQAMTAALNPLPAAAQIAAPHKPPSPADKVDDPKVELEAIQTIMDAAKAAAGYVARATEPMPKLPPPLIAEAH